MATVPYLARPGAPAEATSELYDRYGAQIFVFCLKQLGSREEAEDAVQSTFLNAFRGLKRGIAPADEAAWLFTIAHNVCRTRRRSTWRRERVEAPTDFGALEEVLPAPEPLGADELIPLQDALEAMPASQRKAILLREWQGLSYREIGELLGLSQAAVEALIFRARRTLASSLEGPSRLARLRPALDAGWLAAGLKALFSGGAVAKAVATAAVVTTATVVAAGPLTPKRERAAEPAPAVRAPEPAAPPARQPAAVAALAPRAVAQRHTADRSGPVQRAVGKPRARRVAVVRKASRRATAIAAQDPVAAPSAPPAPVHKAHPRKAKAPKPRPAPEQALAQSAIHRGNANGHARQAQRSEGRRSDEKPKKQAGTPPAALPATPPSAAEPLSAAEPPPVPPQADEDHGKADDKGKDKDPGGADGEGAKA